MKKSVRPEMWRFKKYLVAACALGGILVCSIQGAKPHSLSASKSIPSRKPNIIFILADDLGYGDLGSYGQKRIKTPNIDQMASQGIRFTTCYAGSTVCAPSRSVLMTGQHTGHTRIRGNARHPLQPEDITVAEVLQSAGYKTGLIGKWGLGEAGSTGIPNEKGFDYFFGYLNQVHAHNYYPSFLWRNREKVLLKNQIPNEDNQGGGVANVRSEYSHDLFVQEALQFIEKQRESPFFLYLALTIPHANNEAKAQGMEVPSNELYAKTDWPEAEKNKAAMISRMDNDVGILLKKLKDLGIDRDTVVFFSSDNGPHKEGGTSPAFMESSGPLRGIKRDLYEGGIRVPMIVRWPGRIRSGSSSSYPWYFCDFLPTAAAIAGVKAPQEIDGISVLPSILGKPQKPHEYFYWEFHEGGTKQAVRMGDWKGIRLAQGEPLELYNLKKDPSETQNVATKHPEIVNRIEEYLLTARTESEHWPIQAAKTQARK